ncbi:MAG: hypothetical protein GY810_05860 [Aureispira sp.]|nr:hypothetical protein [Aureispira sp.]
MHISKWIIALNLLLFSYSLLLAQNLPVDSLGYAAINENLFVNTKWQYTYTTHAESNTIIHKADKDYEYYLFFKYDYSYEMYLNSKLTYGEWKLNNLSNEIYYEFRKIKWWRIAEFTEETLILEFSLNTKSSYRYHFIRTSDAQAPFERSPFDLPDVNVNHAPGGISGKNKYRYVKAELGKRRRYNKRREERRKLKEQRRKDRLAKLNKTPIEDLEFLKIELVGGGFYGGPDPVYRNILTVKTDGRVIWEYQTELKGLVITKSYIPRKTLEDLVAFIEEKNFFTFQKTYTCETQECARRITKKPRPIALRLAITKGHRRHIVTISIWERTDSPNPYVNYPDELDAIIEAIQQTAIYQQQ